MTGRYGLTPFLEVQLSAILTILSPEHFTNRLNSRR